MPHSNSRKHERWLKTMPDLNLLILVDKPRDHNWVEMYMDMVPMYYREKGAPADKIHPIYFNVSGKSQEEIVEAMNSASVILIDTRGRDKETSAELFEALETQNGKPTAFVSADADFVLKQFREEYLPAHEASVVKLRPAMKAYDSDANIRQPDGSFEVVKINEFDPERFCRGSLPQIREWQEKNGLWNEQAAKESLQGGEDHSARILAESNERVAAYMKG